MAMTGHPSYTNGLKFAVQHVFLPLLFFFYSFGSFCNEGNSDDLINS